MPCESCGGCDSGTSRELDRVTALLCDACQMLEGNDIIMPHTLSVWWLNHKNEDRKRVERELAEAETKREKKAAIAKLTPYERKLLGIRE